MNVLIVLTRRNVGSSVVEGIGNKGMQSSDWTFFLAGRCKQKQATRTSIVKSMSFVVENPLAVKVLSRMMSSKAGTRPIVHEQAVKSQATTFVTIEIVTTLKTSRQAVEKGRSPHTATKRPLHPLVSIRVAPSVWGPKLGLVPLLPSSTSPSLQKTFKDLKTAPFSTIFSDSRVEPRHGQFNGIANGRLEGKLKYRGREARQAGPPLRGRPLVNQICQMLNCPDDLIRLSEMDPKLDTYHVAEVLRCQKDVLLALKFFNWTTTKAGFQHNLFTYHIMIGMLVRSREFDHALRLVHGMYGVGCKPDVVTFTILISGFAAANRPESALEVLKTMREVGCNPNFVTYNVLISMNARNGMYEEAWKLFGQMKLEGVQANPAIYSSMINCLGKAGLVTAANDLFDEMKGSGCVPDVITYTTIIDLHSKAGLYQEAIGYYREMQKAGLKPDIVILCAVMDCLGKAGDVTGANRVFEDLKSRGYLPDAVAYTNVIDIHAKAGFHEKAVQLFNEMRNSGVQANTVNYNSIIDCLGKAGNVSAAYMLFQEMKTLGFVPDLKTYSMMMCLHARLGLQDTCLNLFEELQLAGLQPSTAILVAMIDCLGKTGNFDAALDLFSEIKSEGYILDVVCYTRMIDICANCGHYDKALEFYTEMQQAGLEPNIFTYNAVIKCLGKSGNPNAAQKFVREMQQKGCKPNIVTYNTLMDLFSKAGKPNLSLEIFANLHRDDVQPDSVTFITMMEALGKAGHPAEVENIFQRMVESGCNVKLPAYNILIDAWRKAGNIERVDHWYKELVGSGQKPDEVTAKSLIIAYLRSKEYDSVRLAIQTLSATGFSDMCSVAAILLQHFSGEDQQEHIGAMLSLMADLGHPADTFVQKLLLSGCRAIEADCKYMFESLPSVDKESKMMFLDALILFLYSQKCNLEAGYIWDYAAANDFYPLAVTMKKKPNHWAMDFHSMSVGTAVVALTRTLATFREKIIRLKVVPGQVSIVTGWGRGSRVPGCSTVKQAVQETLDALGSPFYVDEVNMGRFICSGDSFAKWVQQI